MELKQLCEIHAPSGDEGQLRKLLLEEGKRLCGAENARIDRSGNVVCTRKGTQPGKPHVCVSAHMDEVGFIIEAATEDGLLRFHPIGGIDPRVVVSKRVLVGRDLLPGVIGAMAIHLQSAADRNRVLGFDGLYIDIGAKDKAEALAKCPVGTYAYFDTPYQPFGDGFVCAKALDDRVGCAILMQLLANDYECDFYGVFTVQEEVGLRGMYAAAYSVAPDVVIVLEGTTANDMPEVKNVGFVTKMSHGPAISFMDNATIVSPDMFKALTETANTAGIKWQPRQGTTGANDQGPAQRMRAGCKTGCISVPCRYIHSPASIADIDDIMGAYALADAFLKNKNFNEVL